MLPDTGRAIVGEKNEGCRKSGTGGRVSCMDVILDVFEGMLAMDELRSKKKVGQSGGPTDQSRRKLCRFSASTISRELMTAVGKSFRLPCREKGDATSCWDVWMVDGRS